MARLTLQNVSKSYDGRQAIIKGIDLEVEDGEFIVMVGPSGCGKSTLLRMVAGLEQVSGGDIYIGDERVTQREPKDRGVAMVFQNYALYPHMTVADNMGYGLKIRGLGKQQIRRRVEEVAQILELGTLLDRRPGELSGGQRQRVAMGRAIVREPAVFLFDEPLSNLDAKLRVQMRLELQQLHRRLKTTSLYVTHDQVEAMTLAQRVIVLNKGVAEQIGTPTEIYHRPASRFVAGFMGAPVMNLFDGALADDGQTFCLAQDQRIRLQRPLPGLAGRSLTLGIRPEHLRRADATEGETGNTLTIDTLELLGADNLAHGRWGDQGVTVRLPYQAVPAIGSVLQLVLPQDNLHFFEPSDGRRIALSAEEPSS
ncbi:Glycerol-3-phosphate ABC transporter, ATP-binding protein UgpC [Edwardsiella anguillarum]|uniref:sn-glycerol-3-phosphate import ATP-binding protein UgpC n=1 Tax=Edwardsiella TaxID=635 RepID=UPI00045D0947|nr:sn-glycerol-3-phosphate import ATP-binding protein UgpC [Edwardsiella anguillarum]AKM46592.1 glycerol-3-phosphate transporter ATP-binding subunit [Edwardsiella sp. EA181011]GAJ67608.1 SN-glycerol-3-phosphate transport ATP-binding protein UgpC [Edwardsiella piscicida]RFT05063.1 ABC transporter ATP-binding protein [Edwardsiella anguillarum]BET82274.1 Glycerol-3-phosphate ABC transporter, ATP-binding protein UgpC [Edwardsiella anguillarum]BET85703.1 Glycerol-3-phosphate ABC transporter, ATP-bi